MKYHLLCSSLVERPIILQVIRAKLICFSRSQNITIHSWCEWSRFVADTTIYINLTFILSTCHRLRRCAPLSTQIDYTTIFQTCGLTIYLCVFSLMLHPFVNFIPRVESILLVVWCCCYLNYAIWLGFVCESVWNACYGQMIDRVLDANFSIVRNLIFHIGCLNWWELSTDEIVSDAWNP